MSVFEKFDYGKLYLPFGKPVLIKNIEWLPHVKFDGVEMKNLISSSDTDGLFSYHLVRISPGKIIGLHSHSTQLETHEVITGDGVCTAADRKIIYEVGTVAVLPAGTEHEVVAGSEGLCLFAKFFPALS